MRALCIVAICVMLAACSSTPKDLETQTTPSVQAFSENYQEIYRRVSTVSRRCFAHNMNSIASVAVDTDLYSDLGYGTVTVSLIDMGVRNYYVSAKIERKGSGSTMTLNTGNTLAADRYRSYILGWASGDESCPIV